MADSKILLVEDDPSVSQVIMSALRAENMIVKNCKTVTERDKLMAQTDFDLLITDVGLGEDDGIATLDAVKVTAPNMPIIVISAQNTLDTAVRASENGAFEYFPKPFDLDELIEVVEQALSPHDVIASEDDFEEESLPLVGLSPPMQEVYRMIARLLRNDLSVLVLGESGTGKELVAEAIHNLGHRKSGPFVAVNMAAIPAELIEAELFGHEKGAFTGAVSSAAGKFEQAQTGTLFLDEIGDMPMHAQTRLLRALQSGEISRVGGKDLIKLDVRIIAATNQDFEKLIAQGKFREDLYYRINVVPIELPPLRDRSTDIPALVKHFLKQAASEGLPHKLVTEDAMEILSNHHWRGNVRELQNVIYRLLVTAREETLSTQAVMQVVDTEDSGSSVSNLDAGADFPTQVKLLVSQLLQDNAVSGSVYSLALEKLERPLLEQVMLSSNGNQIQAARILGINRNTLRKKLNDYRINPAGS